MAMSAPVTPASNNNNNKSRRTPPRPSSSSSTPIRRLIPSHHHQQEEEKILVTVRIRPLTPRELSSYDLIAWDCTDENTLVSRNLNHDRHNGTYTFGKNLILLLHLICFLYVSF